MKYLFLLLLLILPVSAEEVTTVEETRARIIGIWTPSRGYFTLKNGGGATPEMIEYKATHRFNPDGTWEASDFRKGTWSVEEPNVLILDPGKIGERMFRLTFLGDELVRKGPYLRDGKLSRLGVTYIYYEEVKQPEAPEKPDKD